MIDKIEKIESLAAAIALRAIKDACEADRLPRSARQHIGAGLRLAVRLAERFGADREAARSRLFARIRAARAGRRAAR